ncbi:Probable endonuclease LCL3 [Seminavis robusta]|uniref:Probable endonuclease LCL3 n=1 Tax=Seminavis robusta TaxID=568900 RepID=A0A9N8DU88_9STRA|nr:Probable endonuclease LCL3 [Seminavis robusta]|eukprot:Sro294_g110280.1 Probable endonuclease LCL3 (309) ;mRNA; r:56511-57541
MRVCSSIASIGLVLSAALLAPTSAFTSSFNVAVQRPTPTTTACPQLTTVVRLQESKEPNNIDSTSAAEANDTRRGFFKEAFGTAAALALQTKTATAATAAEEPPKYNTAKDIPESLIDSHQYLVGYVEKVIDGDTVRIRHVPNVQAFLTAVANNSNKTNKRPGPLSNSTIVVRMYGVDAPETAKKQEEVSQPFGDDAKQLTKDLVYHKLVAVKLLRRDKYNRIVAEVETYCVSKSTCDSTDVSVELISRGLATLYTGGGAEYDGKKDLLKERLQAAQKSKVGIWSLGDEMVTPAEFKRKKRQEEQQQQ